MSAAELFHDPVELSDELDDVIRAQEMLRQRTIALQARYRALQPLAESGRYDKPGEHAYATEEFGSVNVEGTARRLETAVRDMDSALKYWLTGARELAVKVREYPRPEREQDELSASGQVIPDSGLASDATSALAGYSSTDNALADAIVRDADREGRSL
ncbi:hypothetical protein ACFYT3_14315 [Nocardia amikacinitolerans]|uniref:hypothetical protein n=1 Tax=Nocardia amikacinitolerans TaxID=756689 RepID=UPI0036A0212A